MGSSASKNEVEVKQPIMQ